MEAKNSGNASGDRENSHPRPEKRQYQQHTIEQIQRLESYFKECANPDEHQREELSRELGLDPIQIKFWLRNKRTQKKTRNEKEVNSTLRSENDNLLAANIALQEVIKSMMGADCGSSDGGNRMELIKALMLENVLLKEHIKNTSNLVSGQPWNAPGQQPGIEPSQLQGDGAATSGPQPNPCGPEEAPHLVTSRAIRSLDNNAILEIAASAMNELLELLTTNEPVWVNSADGRCTLHRDTYDRLFSMPSLSPVNITDISMVVDGGDTQKVEILPSGFVISRDGRAGASSSEPSRSPEGLVTMVLQILVSGGKTLEPLSMETVTTIHTLISSTVKNIREALDCAKEG